MDICSFMDHKYVLNLPCCNLELWQWSVVVMRQNFPFANATKSSLLFPAFHLFSLFYFCGFLLIIFLNFLQNLSQTVRGPPCCKLLAWLRVCILNAGPQSHLNLLLRYRYSGAATWQLKTHKQQPKASGQSLKLVTVCKASHKIVRYLHVISVLLPPRHVSNIHTHTDIC